MKRLVLLLILLAITAGGGAYYYWNQSETGLLIRNTHRFFECIKFKEFDEAAEFHHPEDQKKADIPKLIEDKFMVKPENLDIQSINVLFAEIDSSGKLARVKTNLAVKTLNPKRDQSPDVMLYWHKIEDKWYLKLESSLH